MFWNRSRTFSNHPPDHGKRVATLDFFPLSHDFCTALRNNGLEAVLKQYETDAVQNEMTKFTLEIVRKSKKFTDFVAHHFFTALRAFLLFFMDLSMVKMPYKNI